MFARAAAIALTLTLLAVAGCGGSDETDTEADNEAIRELVAKLNEATSSKDASAFCLIIQPSAVEETFNGIDQCVRETRPILRLAGEQDPLEIENIEVDGDIATVSFQGGTGSEARLVREDGQWYVPLNQATATGDSGSGEAG